MAKKRPPLCSPPLDYCAAAFVVTALLCFPAIFPGTASAATLAPVTRNLELWVSADTLNLSENAAVSTWRDLSGNGNDLTSPQGLQPSYTRRGPGGHPAVWFIGGNSSSKVNNVLFMPLTGEWRGVTVFVAGYSLDSGPFINTSDQVGALFSPGSAGYWLLNENAKVPGFPEPSQNPSAAEVGVISAGFDDRGVMRLATYFDGKPLANTQDADAVNGIIFNKNGTIGTTNSAGYGPYGGVVSELLIYKGTMTDREREAVERYLMVKYGVASAAPGESVAPAAPIAHPKESATHATDFGHPSTDGLLLWSRPEDLAGADGAPVTRWPDASGHGNALTSDSPAPPIVKSDGIGHWPTVVFGEGAQTRDSHSYLNIPLAGRVRQVSMIFVGSGFADNPLIDTAPLSVNTIRNFGQGVQFCGGDLSLGGAFSPLLGFIGDAQAIEIDANISQSGGTLATYCNGIPQQTVTVPAGKIRNPLLFNGARIGDSNHGEGIFKGAVSEVLIYDHVLTAAEREATTAYLTRKYGLVMVSPEAAKQARSPFSLTMAHFPTRQSWLGNSFPGHDVDKKEWVQSGIFDITARPDGTIIACSVYDEPGKNIGFYKDGAPLPMGGGPGAAAMLVDGDYLYLGVSGMSKLQSGIRRYRLDLTEAPWPGMNAGDALWFQTEKPWQEDQGLVAIDGRLYCSRTGSNNINVVDEATGKILGKVPCPAQPGRLAVGENGTLWVAQPDRVIQMRVDGTLTGREVDDVVPGGIAVNGAGHLLVADNGKRHQVLVYDVSGGTARQVASIGSPGGVWAPPAPGEMGPDRLLEVGSISVDGAGNIYVLCAGHQIRAYSPQGKLLWHIECTCFCAVGDFDPATDGNDYYNGFAHYKYRPQMPAGQDWEWSGITYDSTRFPELAQADSHHVIVRRIEGHLLRFSDSEGVAVHRRVAGSEIFAPCAIYDNQPNAYAPRPAAAPAKGEFIWTDRNGDGLVTANEISTPDPKAAPSRPSYDLFIDSKGGLWEPEDRWGMRYTPMQGITPQGVPIYDFAHQAWLDRPGEFIQVLRCFYYPETDTMILAGNTWDHPATGKETWGGCGREAIRYGDWSKPTRHIVCRMPFPDSAWTLMAMAVSTTAHRLFVGETGTAVVFVYDTDTGKLLGCIEPNLNVFGPVGWIDNGGGVRCFTRANGDSLVVVEDSYLEKAVVYTIAAGAVPSLAAR